MDSSLSILGAIAFIVFHLAVTLPLAAITARQFAYPWIKTHAAQDESVTEWMVTVALFALMAAAFALRAHVISAGAAHGAAHGATHKHA